MSEPNDLEHLALLKFEVLSEAESRLLRAASEGATAICGTSHDSNDPSNDPFVHEPWGTERRIRAALIRWLCTDRLAGKLVNPQGLRIHGAWIEDLLDLSFLDVPLAIGMISCVLNGGLRVCFANLRSLDFKKIGLPGLDAESVTVKQSFCLRDSWCFGELRLFNASIGADLVLVGSSLKNQSAAGKSESGMALNAQHIRVGGSIVLRGGFAAEGLIWLLGAQVGGNLECENASLKNAPMKDLPWTGVTLVMDGAKISGAVLLDGGFASEGELRLAGATIGGDLNCTGGQFRNPTRANLQAGGIAINAPGVSIMGTLYLADQFYAQGRVDLDSAVIRGNIDCTGGRFSNPFNAAVSNSGVVINAENISVGGSVQFRDKFDADGVVWLSGASIEGVVTCDGARIRNPAISGVTQSGLALAAMHARLAGGVFLNRGFSAEGCVSLVQTEIGRNLVCDSGQFMNKPSSGVDHAGTAIDLEGARIAGDAYFRSGFVADGRVNLYRASIGGSVEADGAQLRNPAQEGVKLSGVALSLEYGSVSGGVMLRAGLRAEGEVRLMNCKIGGTLDCGNSRFQNPPLPGVAGTGSALIAQDVKIGGSVLLRNDFVAEGEVNFCGAEIGRSVECDGGRFFNSKKDMCENSGIALSFKHARVNNSVFLRSGFESHGIVGLNSVEVGGDLDLRNGRFELLSLSDASVDTLSDDQASWPEHGNLALDGFTYNRIAVGPAAAEERLTWLRRQDPFTRQPYRQLAKVLRDFGDESGSRFLSAMLQENVWKARGRKALPLRLLLKATIGYGYFSIRAVWWLLAVIVLGCVIYTQAYDAGSIVPTEREAYSAFAKSGAAPPYYGQFHAFFYSLENSFPLIRLGVEDKWHPAEMNPGIGSQVSTEIPLLSWVSKPAFLKWFRFAPVGYSPLYL